MPGELFGSGQGQRRLSKSWTNQKTKKQERKNEMELIKLGRVDDVSVALVPTAEARRDALLVKSEVVKAVNTPEQQEEAMEFARRIKRALNDVEAARKDVKRPILDLEEKIDGIAKAFVKSMRDELDRLMLLVSGFQSRERIRIQFGDVGRD